MLGRIEAHICICFTAYTIMLELERELKAAKSDITLYQAGRLTKTIYQLNYKMPNSHHTKSVILQMDSKQKELYDIVLKNGLKKITHLGRDRTYAHKIGFGWRKIGKQEKVGLILILRLSL